MIMWGLKEDNEDVTWQHRKRLFSCGKGRELGVGQLVKLSESLVLLPERELVWYIINKCAVC